MVQAEVCKTFNAGSIPAAASKYQHKRQAPGPTCRLGAPREVSPASVFDLARSFALYGIAHHLQLLRRMTDPVDKLTYDA